MQNIENKVIVYDDVCPMCRAYTAGFVQLGWLKHRTGFADTPPGLLEQFDLDRARHEIPLLDIKTGEVVYGLDALFFIVGNRMPFFKPLFRNRFFRTALFQLYQIITYNRRVIAGSKAPSAGFDCAPDVNLFYRWLYIGLTTAGAGFLFWRSAIGYPAISFLLGIAIPAVLFTRQKLDFAGHWATVALVNALLISLLPKMALVHAGIAGLTVWMSWKRWKLLTAT